MPVLAGVLGVVGVVVRMGVVVGLLGVVAVGWVAGLLVALGVGVLSDAGRLGVVGLSLGTSSLLLS